MSRVPLSAAAFVLLGACWADFDGLSGGSSDGGIASGDGGGGAESGPAPGGDGSADAPSPADANPPDSGGDGVVTVLPGFIRCGSTTTTCEIATSECCLMVSGDDSNGRAYSSSQARCQPIGGPNCGSYVSVGGSFTMVFPQRCAAASDCAAGTVCCAESGKADPLSTEIRDIVCLPLSTCNAKGRTLCTATNECPAPTSCLAESDPVLSHVFARDCR